MAMLVESGEAICVGGWFLILILCGVV